MTGPRVHVSTSLLALALAGAASAAPSQLNTIPTADVVPVRQLSVQIQNANTDLRGDPTVFQQPEPAFQTQLGLFSPRFEGGLDLVPLDSPGDYQPILNLKAVPLAEGYNWPALAVGVGQLGPGSDALYYIVASRTLNYRKMQYQKFRAHHRNLKLRGVRLHAGMNGIRNNRAVMLGSDIELSDHFVLDADWISGKDHAATLGGTWVLDQKNSIQAIVFHGNARERIDGVQIGMTHQFGW